MVETTDAGGKRKHEKKDKKRKHKHESHRHRKHHKHKRERKDKDSDRHRERPHKRAKKRRHSGSGSSSRSSGSSSDDDEPRERKRARASSPGIGPPAPPPAHAMAAALGIGLSLPTRPPPPTHRQPAAAAPPSARAMAAGKGGGLSAYLRCLPCGTESSSEAAFKQHLCGKPHMRANGGRAGFAGLAANSAGVIPPLQCPALRYHAAKMGQDPDGSARGGGSTAAPPPAVWQPPLRSIAVTPAAEATLRAALSGATERRAQKAQDYFDGAAEGSAPAADSADHAAGAGARANGARRPPRPMPPPPPVVRGGGPHAASRRALPVYEARAELLAALAQPSCIVEGETGSGKTTQVPQYLLEAAAEAGEPVSIICTQPRRISAIGVAERVAAERGERVGAPGGAVGYARMAKVAVVARP